MDRVIVIGCSGSGKSTLSQKLHKILQLPIIHLDRYYWKANWQATEQGAWDQKVTEFALTDRWIIDGNYSRTLDIRIERADVIVFLDMPRWLCMYRIVKRRIQYHGKTRPDLNKDCPEKLDIGFLKWVWDYRKRNRVKTLEKLKQVKQHQKVVIIRNKKQLEELVEQLSSY
ncbi:adenylate kinase family enzyme [Paenibacillus sp. SORGH_AS306]|uniref:DNA topology modulation protein n=2 Tax=unclassified Paenibacillus TaxID=185978 RepID=UPI00278565F7|nr:DNA topology modulation protein [Paenibacillus sp. SORGH_AS_0306]MDQ1235145.1 adenylate kinase family enzyme [Paenibacillus sp. SORGH_AS_0306]